MIQLHTISLLGVPFVTNPKHELLEFIKSRWDAHLTWTIFTPNPEIVVEVQRNNNFKSVCKDTINIPDGIGIQLFTGIQVIKGRVLFVDILELAYKNNKKVFLYGTSKEIIEKSLQRIRNDYPGLYIEGMSAPLYSDKGKPQRETDEVIHQQFIETILTWQPDIVFVALGAPKQEFLINELQQKIPKASFMAIGGALDSYSGVKKMPQEVFVRFGLEWLFRLIQEPFRLKRIFTAVIVFPFLVILSRITYKN